MSRRLVTALEVLGVVLAGVLLFLLRFGPRVLGPSEVDWLLARDDPASYFLIWDFYRHEHWTFPLGLVSSYLSPLGTSLPLVDGLPLLAMPAKLVSAFLPPVFQYFGLWHGLCSILQALFGYRIARRYFPDTSSRLLCAVLFLLAPVFLYREGHIALSSHWLILAALDMYLTGDDGGWRWLTRRWCVLLGVAALVHPYLVAMAMLFFAGLVLRPQRSDRLPWRGRLGAAGIVASTILCLWWVAGYFHGLGDGSARLDGFGRFSLNLAALFNPMSQGGLLPNLPIRPGQYEGFAYLGAGWILILTAGVMTAACLAANRRSIRVSVQPHLVLLLFLLAAFLFALSNVVTWRDRILFQYPLPAFLELPAGVFRVSGRFVWPLIYASGAGLMAILGRALPRWAGVLVLSSALVLQIVDMRTLIFQKQHFESLHFESRLAAPDWEVAAAASTGITTFPPFQHTTVQNADYRDICWLARQHHLPTTAGYAARLSGAAPALVDSMLAAFASGTADSTELYITDRASFPAVFAGLGNNYLGGLWDGYWVCYNRKWPVTAAPSYTAARRCGFPEFLARCHDRTLLIAARDEATSGLSATDRQALKSVGIVEADLTYRGALAAIVHHGQSVWQRIDSRGRVEFSLAAGETVGGFRSAFPIHLVSAGYDAGNEACLRLNDKDEGFNGRGLNVLVLDDQQHLVEVAWFDTFVGKPGIVVTVADRETPGDT